MNKNQNTKEQDDTKFDISKIENDLSEELIALSSMFEGDTKFESELKSILTAILENGADISKLEPRIMSLIEALIQRASPDLEELEKARGILEQKKEQISQHLRDEALMSFETWDMKKDKKKY